MEYWHTATPYQPQSTGWVGRLADSYWPEAKPSTIVNIAQKQSLAVQSARHSPVVLSRPEEFVRAGDSVQADELIQPTDSGNDTLEFLAATCKNAADGSLRVREAVRNYKSPIPYGSTPLAIDLQKVQR